MTRFKLTLEYEGSAFVGWQRQDNGMSVQQAIEEAVFKTCAENVNVQGAGRTDAGVHALGQVAHLDIEKDFAPDKLAAALNFHLKPWPVAILAAEVAGPDFHARFSASGRAYLYRIANRRAPLTLDEGRAWLVNAPLDAVWAAWHDPAVLRRWLPGADFEIRRFSPNKALHLNWPDGTWVSVTFAESAGKSKIVVTHRKLRVNADVGKMQLFWQEALDRLKAVLES